MEATMRTILTEMAAAGPWAIQEDALAGIFKAIEGPRAAEIVIGPLSARPGGLIKIGSVGILPIRGFIFHRGGALTQFFGLASAESLLRQFNAMMAEESIKTIVLDVNSPGGTVAGISEVADAIFAARGVKRVVAVANALAASAAYWITSQADQITVIPNGEVGSIGILVTHSEFSKMDEHQGIKTTIIRSGKFKAEANPFEPLSKEARADIQSKTDAVHAEFIDAVARGRGATPAQVRAGFGQGRTVLSQNAVMERMADRVAGFDETIAGLLEAPTRRGGRIAAEEIKTVRQAETALRDVGGLSQNEAAAFLAAHRNIIKAGPRDAVPEGNENDATGRDGPGEPTEATALHGLADRIRQINARSA